MLPHETGKLAVFSVELENADPVLDFLQKHVAYTSIWTVHMYFLMKIKISKE